MDGRLTIEDGDILDLMRLVVGANRWEDKGGGRKALNKGKRKWRALFRRNEAGKSRKNVAHHYDVGNDLYRLFLDDDMQYSCAYFTDPANSLEQAQADKKAHIAAKLDLKPGQKVLDIGCGWGGTALYLNRVADVDVLGITLSEEQLKVARQRARDAGVADRVKFELIDYRSVEGQFDRIVSIGMFEHVGAAHYDEFFATCRELLTDDGVMLLHTIGKYGKAAAPDPFTDKWIFPGYHLPSISQIGASTEKMRFIISDFEILRLHYAYTLDHWLQADAGGAGQDRRAVRRALLPDVGILSRRRGGGVRERVDVQLPGAICPRPPRRCRSPATTCSRPSSAIARWTRRLPPKLSPPSPASAGPRSAPDPNKKARRNGRAFP